MRSLSLLAGCSLALGLLVSGCSKLDQKAADQEAADKAAADKSAAETAADGKVAGESDAVAAAFAELSPEEAAAARKQGICPVGGGPLGTMGKPFKVTLDGRDVYLCCEHCEADLKADPEKYLAKLKQ